MRSVLRCAFAARRTPPWRRVGVARGAGLSTGSDAARSTTASGSTVYESARAADEYLQFHFGAPKEVLPYEDAPHSALDFLPGLARACAEHSAGSARALDVGCAVGRASFELSAHFEEVVGVDFSHGFVEAARAMQRDGEAPYTAVVTAQVTERRVARLPAGARPERVRFAQGDACALNVDELSPGGGRFDAVLASNLLCRLPRPAAFLASLPALVSDGGAFVLASPYSWLDEYTPREQWLGGYRDASGAAVDSFGAVRASLEPHFELVARFEAPFLIREHARKFQWSSSDTSVWRRR